jgi:hypothetical protein
MKKKVDLGTEGGYFQQCRLTPRHLFAALSQHSVDLHGDASCGKNAVSVGREAGLRESEDEDPAARKGSRNSKKKCDRKRMFVRLNET